MPTYTAILEDTCPPLVYSSDWLTGSSATDNETDTYTAGSYRLTKTQGGTMSFSFNGTGIGIYGAKRPGYGLYQVQVDGKTLPTFDASSQVALFNQTLFNATLDNGYHTVILTNAGNTTLDVDYVAFESVLGQEAEQILVDTFQDNHPNFVYSPASSWNAPSRPGTYSGSTGHVTTDPNATLTYSFEGMSRRRDTVLLYGPVTPQSVSAYFVQVDGGAVLTYSVRKQYTKAHQVLYYGTGLGAGTHSLHISFDKSHNETAGQFAVDFTNIYTTTSLGGNTLVATPVITTKLSKGVTAGLAVTSAIAFLALLALLALLWRQRRSRSELRSLPQRKGAE
ncbi:hypothetical protein B0H34DRAFT_795501 [Crassisporium funariophilum]|nr:hypothetical protein B0H34DRAFT_795501 [Crassisporium funariophilum]